MHPLTDAEEKEDHNDDHPPANSKHSMANQSTLWRIQSTLWRRRNVDCAALWPRQGPSLRIRLGTYCSTSKEKQSATSSQTTCSSHHTRKLHSTSMAWTPLCKMAPRCSVKQISGPAARSTTSSILPSDSERKLS